MTKTYIDENLQRVPEGETKVIQVEETRNFDSGAITLKVPVRVRKDDASIYVLDNDVNTMADEAFLKAYSRSEKYDSNHLLQIRDLLNVGLRPMEKILGISKTSLQNYLNGITPSKRYREKIEFWYNNRDALYESAIEAIQSHVLEPREQDALSKSPLFVGMAHKFTLSIVETVEVSVVEGDVIIDGQFFIDSTDPFKNNLERGTLYNGQHCPSNIAI
jgi:hypothetical protein